MSELMAWREKIDYRLGRILTRSIHNDIYFDSIYFDLLDLPAMNNAIWHELFKVPLESISLR